MQSHEAVEERDSRRLPCRLFKRELRVGADPVLVIAFCRQVDVEAAHPMVNLTAKRGAVSRLLTPRPEWHTVSRAQNSSTCP